LLCAIQADRKRGSATTSRSVAYRAGFRRERPLFWSSRVCWLTEKEGQLSHYPNLPLFQICITA